MKKFLLLMVMMSVLISCSKAEVSQAPDFSLKTIENKTVKLSDYKKKIVIINFWATWCPPCRAELPDFVKFYDEYNSKGVEIIGIAVNSRNADIKSVIEQYKIKYPICISDKKVEAEYGGIRGVPTTFIIDKTGKIVLNRVGMIKEKELVDIVRRLLL
ncbi:TlpA family protein disulfide reductase [bacterium]|nr:TlpA family protein disulfide reductase [bacterium]